MSEPRRGMGRFRRTLEPVAAALVLCSGLVVLSAVGAAGSSDPSVETACSGTLSGSVFILTADCDTTVPLTIPDGVTLNGAGFTITAHDVTPASFDGSVLSNAGTSMNIEDLTIMGTGFTMPPGVCSRTTLNGIFFNGAGGSVTNVNVTGITENSNCQVGRAIVATGTVGQTLTITGTTVSDYNKNGIQASGMTMNVSGSVIGPPASLPPRTTGQNGLVYLDGATGTTSGSAIYGNGYGGVASANVAVLVFGATNVTLTGDTITGDGTDIGVAVAPGSTGQPSTGVIVDRNQIGRTTPDVPDIYGFGVELDPGSTATVTCNTFSGWKTDLSGVPPQPPCITTTELPPAELNTPYMATLEAIGGTPPYTWSIASGSLPPGLSLSSDGTVSGTPTATGTFTFSLEVVDSLGASAQVTQSLDVTVETDEPGYWLAAADGGVFALGSATFYGSAVGLHPVAPVVGMAASPTGGYWLVASDGGVFSFGAPFFGSLAGQALGARIVGMAATPEGDGYYLVGANGSVFAFGAAVFRGSMQGARLNAPVVGIAVTADNQGYYLVAADGGVFAFGDARFQGSMGGQRINQPVVGMSFDDSTSGYWLVARDGGVFAFDAPFFGSTGGFRLNAPVVALSSIVSDSGYYLAASDGGVFAFGSAPFLGSMGGTHLNAPVVGSAALG
jgi:hypothetical protein